MRTAAPTAHPDEEEVHQHGESCGQDGHAAQQNQKTAEGTHSQVLFPRNQIDAINYTQLHKQEFIPVHPLCTKSFVCVRERERVSGPPYKLFLCCYLIFSRIYVGVFSRLYF